MNDPSPTRSHWQAEKLELAIHADGPEDGTISR